MEIGRSVIAARWKTGRVRAEPEISTILSQEPSGEAPHKRSYWGQFPSPASIFRLQVFQQHTRLGGAAQCDSGLADHF